VDNSSPPLDGFIVEDCSDDEDLEEEQLNFTIFEEEYERSPPSSLAPVTPEIPASPKGASFNRPTMLKQVNLPLLLLLVVDREICSLPTEASPLARNSCIFQP